MEYAFKQSPKITASAIAAWPDNPFYGINFLKVNDLVSQLKLFKTIIIPLALVSKGNGRLCISHRNLRSLWY
jgi:hypothetical protein